MDQENAKNIIRSIKSHYRTGANEIGEEFFFPSLIYCSEYKRAVGYFSSTALISWAKALPRLASTDDIYIKLIISPELSQSDIDTLIMVTNETQRLKIKLEIIDSIIKDTLRFIDSPEEKSLRLKLFAWLVATERLDLRFAFPKHIEEPGIFHEKIGIFTFPWGDQIAFNGSANETLSGHKRNYESIDVYRSWEPYDKERVSIKKNQFDEAWENLANGLEVLLLKPETIKFIKAVAPFQKPIIMEKSTQIAFKENNMKWRHQDEAVQKFLEKGHGILEMATGTGKTRTALKILSKLIENKSIDSIIISTDGNDLLDQWTSELNQWGLKQSPPFLVLKHYKNNHELGDFVHDPKNSILVVSRGNLANLCKRLEGEGIDWSRIAIVHDEVHGLGTPSLKKSLPGKISKFKYRLGLSATPEREYDETGTKFIEEEVGDVVYKFDLTDAIKRGILCEFDYIQLEYDLTDEDKARISQVYSKISARKKEGRPMSQEEIWTAIAFVYKTAQMKPFVFQDYLKSHPSIIKNTIIFVETKEYGERLLEPLHLFTHLYRTYYAEDEKQNLVDFSKGKIDCLLTCHKISQGIDIKKLENVILFSSARAKLETIQRIGRCLRTDPNNPNKKALIIDFVRPQEADNNFINADQERCEWLTTLSKIKSEEIGHGY